MAVRASDADAGAPRFACHGCGAYAEPGARLLLCTGCRAARYCGAACQRADWAPWHAAECTSWASLRASADARGLGVSFESSAAWGRHAVLRAAPGAADAPAHVPPGTLLWTERALVAIPTMRPPADEERALAYARGASALADDAVATGEENYAEPLLTQHVSACAEMRARMRKTDWRDAPYATSQRRGASCSCTIKDPDAVHCVHIKAGVLVRDVFDAEPLFGIGFTWYTTFYRLASYFNTSCAPNAFYAFDGSDIVIRAAVSIAAGEQVCLNYNLPRNVQCKCGHCDMHTAQELRDMLAEQGAPWAYDDACNAQDACCKMVGILHDPTNECLEDYPVESMCDQLAGRAGRCGGGVGNNISQLALARVCAMARAPLYLASSSAHGRAVLRARTVYSMLLAPLLDAALRARDAYDTLELVGTLATLALVGMRTGVQRGTACAPERLLLAVNAVAGAGQLLPSELELVHDAAALGPRLYAEFSRRHDAGLDSGTPAARRAAGWDELARYADDWRARESEVRGSASAGASASASAAGEGEDSDPELDSIMGGMLD